jgi:hypothetical protein
MELLEGESLADRLKRAPLSIPETLMQGRQIASALDHVVRRRLESSAVVVVEGSRHPVRPLPVGQDET